MASVDGSTGPATKHVVHEPGNFVTAGEMVYGNHIDLDMEGFVHITDPIGPHEQRT